MKKQTALGLVTVLILSTMACGKAEPASTEVSDSATVSEVKKEVETSAPIPSETEEEPTAVPSPWGDKTFTKEAVQAKIDSGLSDCWDIYQLVVIYANLRGLPDNVLATLEKAFGAYKWETMECNIYRWDEYYKFHDISETDIEKVHAVLDLYDITPDTVFPAMSASELNKKLEANPKIDMAQYATIEDGDAFFPYFSEFGCEVLEQNDHVKIEGPRDITVEWYENIGRVARITNVSDTPVYIDYAFIDCSGTGDTSKWIKALKALPEYDAAYDKIDELANDETVLAAIPKDVLEPGEMTYIRMDYSSHKNMNSHWYLKTYPMKESEVALLNKGEDPKPAIRTREKSEDILLIMKNRTGSFDGWNCEHAVSKGHMVNEQGEPLAFMPFTVHGFDDSAGNMEALGVGSKEYFTSIDGSFSVTVPVLKYKTDETYARFVIMANGEKAPVDGKMVTMVIGELFALDGEVQEGVNYSDYIKGRRVYGQKTAFVQPTEAKEYELTMVVPDKYDYLVYDYYKEEDYGGQANYYDYGGDILATVKFHDETPGANKTAYLNVFNHDGELLMRKPTGVQTCCVCVSPDGTLVGTVITPPGQASQIADFENPPANIGQATIFDLSGKAVFELNHGTRAMEISHDNRLVALDINGENCFGVMDIATKEVLWSNYRGAQVRHLIFSEDDSVLYMGSQESIAAFNAKTGEILWQTFTAGNFPIDMIMSGKYLYVSPKATGGNDNKLCCIDRKTGKMVWTFQTGSRGTKLTLSPDETILFWGNDTGSRDIGQYMLNAENGEPLWTIGYGGQAAWFTSDSQYVAVKAYGILEVFDRDGNKIATTACGSTSKMSWFVYIKDDLSRILNIAGGGDTSNSGWLYNMVLEDGYSREFIDGQRKR